MIFHVPILLQNGSASSVHPAGWPGLFCFRPVNADTFQHVVAWLPVPSELMANLGSNSCHSNDVHQKFLDTASQRRVYGV